MNERIRELAEQTFYYGNWEASQYWEGKGIYTGQLDLEKFAKLIVKECADIADKAEPYKANDLIKQHFGIEE